MQNAGLNMQPSAQLSPTLMFSHILAKASQSSVFISVAGLHYMGVLHCCTMEVPLILRNCHDLTASWEIGGIYTPSSSSQ